MGQPTFSDAKILKKAKMLKENNLYPWFRAIENTVGSRVSVSGIEQIMIGSNNYLGFTHHPEVQEAAIKAIEKFGTGCTGSRFLNGNLSLHEELEQKLADYTGFESAVLFSTGMQSNLGALSALCGPRDCMIYDSENHASLIDASRLAMGPTFKFKHNDLESLEDQLQSSINRFKRVIVVADGVFSMTGSICPVPQVRELCQKYGAELYIDDAHGIGVMGDKGRGTVHYFDETENVDYIMGTFSKSFASIGGFVAGSKESMDYVRHTARAFMFSASMPPSAVATVSKCLEIIMRDDTIHDQLWKNVALMQKGFSELGFYTYDSKTPIIPIFMGDDIKSLKVTNFLESKGIFATPVISPAVPKGEALIRTSYMPSHTSEDLTRVLEVFAEAKKQFNIPTNN